MACWSCCRGRPWGSWPRTRTSSSTRPQSPTTQSRSSTSAPSGMIRIANPSCWLSMATSLLPVLLGKVPDSSQDYGMTKRMIRRTRKALPWILDLTLIGWEVLGLGHVFREFHVGQLLKSRFWWLEEKLEVVSKNLARFQSMLKKKLSAIKARECYPYIEFDTGAASYLSGRKSMLPRYFYG